MTRRSRRNVVPFAGFTYAEAREIVMASRSLTSRLRQRIIEDEAYDPIDSFNDAEVLCALQRLRLEALLGAERPASLIN